MHRAVDVKPLENYLLLIRFDNGEEKVYNCFPLLDDELFKRLKDDAFYKSVHIDNMGLVCWDDSTDIDPYELYEKSEALANFAFAS